MDTTTSWTEDQQQRLQECHDDPDIWVGYWCSDAWGRSANGGSTEEKWHAEPKTVQEIDDGRRLECCPIDKGTGGLHATNAPHQWLGDRVWVVALHGEILSDKDKRAARKREIIGEVRPENVLSPQIAARLELTDRSLSNANLQGADLRGADLRGADLRDADLRGADLQRVDLRGANLRGADLWDANLRGANLRDANLRDANLRGADLRGANLRGANLRDVVDLRGASLENAE